MQSNQQRPGGSGQRPASNMAVWLAAGCLVVVLIAILLPRPDPPKAGTATAPAQDLDSNGNMDRTRGETSTRRSAFGRSARSVSTIPPEQVVADKVRQFAQSRREVLHRMAAHLKVETPATFEAFLNVAEAGDWDALKSAYDALLANRTEENWTEAHSSLWPAIHETYGVAEVAHKWPAQALLDYGDRLLSSLPDGAVYVGGTDAGRFIPTLLNETAEGNKRVVLTQNALADQGYLEYVAFLYGDRLGALNGDDGRDSFTKYIADATQRVAHDRQFPNEPPQLKPGENVVMTEGRVQVSGEVAVMAINELLFQRLMEKNPELTFVIEQSFPFESTFANATIAGPLMELRASDENALTRERAQDTVSYWRSATSDLLRDPSIAGSDHARAAYAKLAVSQATLLSKRKYPEHAEQMYQTAAELCPWMPEVVFQHVQLLVNQNRINEALAVVNRAIQSPQAKDSLPQFEGLANQLRNSQGP